MTTPTYTPNMNLGLPVPGYTGALGVELPGYSWMELQNSAFSAVDSHDHTAGKGVPVSSLGVNVVADFAFAGHAASNTRGIGLADQSASVPTDTGFVYRNGVDLYFRNGSGVIVQITNGASVSAAAGNITGMTGTAAVLFTPGTGSFTFSQATNQRAPLLSGPLSIADPVVNGKTITVSAPSGLAANYALTLPGALPAALSILTLNAAGTVAASSNITDNSTLQQAAGVLSIKDAGVTGAKIAFSTITNNKLAALTYNYTSTVGGGINHYFGSPSSFVVFGTGGLIVIGRPIRISVGIGALANTDFRVSGGVTGGTMTFTLYRNASSLTSYSMYVAAGTDMLVPLLTFLDIGASAGSVSYQLYAAASSADMTLAYGGTRLEVIEL